EPVVGGLVTFTAPSTGASATFTSTNPATIAADGTASVHIQANDTVGFYTVTAATKGAAAASGFSGFSLRNDKVPTTTTVSSAASSSTYGQGVTFSATISPVASTGSIVVGGTADLFIDGTRVQSDVAVTAGSVTFAAVSGLTVTGSPHSVYVFYNGD